GTYGPRGCPVGTGESPYRGRGSRVTTASAYAPEEVLADEYRVWRSPAPRRCTRELDRRLRQLTYLQAHVFRTRIAGRHGLLRRHAENRCAQLCPFVRKRDRSATES